MQTKYTTGQAILVPATIRSAEERNGEIIYHVDTDDLWDGVPEDAIIVNEDAEAQRAMEKFRQSLLSPERPWR